MMFKTQILAIWSIVMLLVPASAIYLIDNYEVGVSREAVETHGTTLYHERWVNSIPDGELPSTDAEDSVDWYWGTISVDDVYWDNAIEGTATGSPRARDTTTTLDNTNYVLANLSGFTTTNDVCYNFLTDMTAYELAGYDAIAINSSFLPNTYDIGNDVWLWTTDLTDFVEIYDYTTEYIQIDNTTMVYIIPLGIKQDLMALSSDAPVFFAVWMQNGSMDTGDWTLEALTLQSEYAVSPLTSYGIVLLFMLTTSIYTMIFASDWVDIKTKKFWR